MLVKHIIHYMQPGFTHVVVHPSSHNILGYLVIGNSICCSRRKIGNRHLIYLVCCKLGRWTVFICLMWLVNEDTFTDYAENTLCQWHVNKHSWKTTFHKMTEKALLGNSSRTLTWFWYLLMKNWLPLLTFILSGQHKEEI